jgi:hypothetical protein
MALSPLPHAWFWPLATCPSWSTSTLMMEAIYPYKFLFAPTRLHGAITENTIIWSFCLYVTGWRPILVMVINIWVTYQQEILCVTIGWRGDCLLNVSLPMCHTNVIILCHIYFFNTVASLYNVDFKCHILNGCCSYHGNMPAGTGVHFLVLEWMVINNYFFLNLEPLYKAVIRQIFKNALW